MYRLTLFSTLLAVCIAGCGDDVGEVQPAAVTQADTAPAVDEPASPPNFLVIIGDDMGVETLASYGIGEVTATTPNLDRLAQAGVQFDHFWVQPTCSPTRATLLTGRYGFRTGVVMPGYPREDLIDVQTPKEHDSERTELRFTPKGFLPPGTVSKPPPFMDLSKPPVDGLPPDEVTLPQLLKALPEQYATAAVGKWHLADSRNGWLDAPNEAGFDYYSGMIMGEAHSHYRWLHVSQGKASIEEGYVDERAVNDGVNWVQQQAEQENPWFLWVALINPHTPFTLPPKHLLKSEASLALTEAELTPENTRPYAMAMMEAMDTLIGRLLTSIPESERDNTYIIFLGDNGSVRWAQPAAPVDPMRAKMSVYEGGIRTPLIVSGPGVARGERTAALANSVDLMATVLDLISVDAGNALPGDRQIDSTSLAGVLKSPATAGPREWIYVDTAALGTDKLNYAIRDSDYKLVSTSRSEALYHIATDPWENNNLLADELSAEQQDALNRLTSRVDELRASETQN